ncbi:SDR family NAD(P)-dependent oxidoreductase [Teichococcus aestuarii]|uniref:2-deoxy-D-gluconate 3-dehydrogenase n=1 Tax=Teichococcus aestuarii TaxID=568898 RepID=A0A2U1V6N6_9PROT|nr:glucose 1-dehydrogenase [Pseudoroseomonas aestuarii]PWC29544.1 2-deoxy-D-gluconate 3-dehydrogenase [Pseudoroseomonas aestuarii]
MAGMFDLTGRVALVTGGNGGIGFGMARGLAACGARIVIAGRSAEKNAAAAAELGGQTLALQAELTDPAVPAKLVEEVLAQAGRLDILVNNAGTNIRKAPHMVTDEEWMTVLDTNLTGVMRLTRAAYPALKASGHGRVINIGSMLSIFGVSFSPAYGASKGAVVQYTKSLAAAWSADGITANAILPGWIDTDLTRKARQDVPTLNDAVIARSPSKRWGDPKDFGGIAAFLASDEAAFITGTAIPVDGGFSIQG